MPEDHVTHRALERVPCVAEEHECRCVRLELLYEASAEDLQPAREIMEKLLAVQSGGKVVDVTSDDRVDLVVLPETLEPFRMKKQRLIVTTIEQGDQRATIERDEATR